MVNQMEGSFKVFFASAWTKKILYCYFLVDCKQMIIAPKILQLKQFM